MDFCQLLHTAQKNDKNTANGARYYSTKFEPPKKVKKETKDLSENIKKFLAKKEAEEQKQRDKDQKKKGELLALRAQDKKATRRVNVMLKRTKSANQSVIEDATDNTHTAVTRAGPDQPDEDDYGYVSTEASQYYDKMMEKYSKMPDEPKFNMFKKKVSTNLSSTKDRVKAALEKEREEAMAPHRRKRKKKDQEGGEDKQDDVKEETSAERKESLKDSREKDPPKPKPKPKAAPPPMSFTELLKIAEKKQFEPIVIEQKPQEEEKLLTKKQKREAEKEREWRVQREARRMNDSSDRDRPEDKTINDSELRNRDRDDRGDNDKEKYRDKNSKNSNGSTSSYKIGSKQASSNSRDSGESRILERQLTRPNASSSDKAGDRGFSSKQTKPSTSGSSFQQPGTDSFKKPNPSTSRPVKPTRVGKSEEFGPPKSKEFSTKSSNRPSMSNVNPKSSIPNKLSEQRSALSSKNTLPVPKNGPSGPRDTDLKRNEIGFKKGAPQVSREKYGGMSKGLPSRELGKPKEFPPRDLKPKQFPPPDVRGIKRKQPIVANKGRIIDDDSEEEYDSELDDFIDDGPEDDEGMVSSMIKDIFGYDKSRYRGLDDDVDDMETPYAQQMREEVISSKLGLKEDLEDMKMEEEEKRRKALRMKKMKR